MKHVSPANTRVSTVDEKNYSIGSEKTVNVGEQILSRKAFDIIVRNDLVRPSNDFSLVGGIGSVHVSLFGDPTEKYKIIATNEKGNAAVGIPGSHLAFGIDSEGRWDKTIGSSSFWTSPIGGGGTGYKLDPPHTVFSRIESKTPVSDSGYINHELIFSGISAQGIHLLYREYTLDNMARSAFSQDLHYAVDSKTIRFRNYKLRLVGYTSSSLSYVIEDD